MGGGVLAAVASLGMGVHLNTTRQTLEKLASTLGTFSFRTWEMLSLGSWGNTLRAYDIQIILDRYILSNFLRSLFFSISRHLYARLRYRKTLSCSASSQTRGFHQEGNPTSNAGGFICGAADGYTTIKTDRIGCVCPSASLCRILFVPYPYSACFSISIFSTVPYRMLSVRQVCVWPLSHVQCSPKVHPLVFIVFFVLDLFLISASRM